MHRLRQCPIQASLRRGSALLLTLALLFHAPMPRACASEEAPGVSAESAILICADSGRVLWEKNARTEMGMASTTKIMTALCALILCPDTDVPITVSAEAVGIEGSSVYLQAGERLTLTQLLYAMMLQSANDAAAAIAIGISGEMEAFVAEMNALARDLGLTGTHFENPHGLDGKTHHTTAYDLAMLTRFALENEAFARIVGTKTYALSLQSGERMLVNHNRLIREDDRFIGVKTGYTRACGRCLVSAAREQDGRGLIAVTLNAPDDWRDHRALMNWGFACTERILLAEKGAILRTLPVSGGERGSVLVRSILPAYATARRGEHRVQVRYELPASLSAPIAPGQRCGDAVILLDGEEHCRLGLFAEEGVRAKRKPKSLTERIRSALRRLLARLLGGNP